MPVILLLAVLAVVFLSSRKAPASGGYGGANQAPPQDYGSPAISSTGFVDRSGGRLGIDAVTGLPFAADSTFGRIAAGQIPFHVDYGTGSTLRLSAPVSTLHFTSPGQVPPPPPAPARTDGGAPPPPPTFTAQKFSGFTH